MSSLDLEDFIKQINKKLKKYKTRDQLFSWIINYFSSTYPLQRKVAINLEDIPSPIEPIEIFKPMFLKDIKSGNLYLTYFPNLLNKDNNPYVFKDLSGLACIIEELYLTAEHYLIKGEYERGRDTINELNRLKICAKYYDEGIEKEDIYLNT